MKENPKTCQKDTPNKLKPDAKKTPFWWLIGNGVLASSHIEGGGVTALLDNLIE